MRCHVGGVCNTQRAGLVLLQVHTDGENHAEEPVREGWNHCRLNSGAFGAFNQSDYTITGQFTGSCASIAVFSSASVSNLEEFFGCPSAGDIHLSEIPPYKSLLGK